jgi:hypothetical protein
MVLVVDQPATIGALPASVAQAAGVPVGYLPGLSMRRIADPRRGETKTDAQDVFIIAEATRLWKRFSASAWITRQCGPDPHLAHPGGSPEGRAETHRGEVAEARAEDGQRARRTDPQCTG